MKSVENVKKQALWAQLLLVVLPTIFVVGFFLWQANSFFSILRNQWLNQAVYFGIGILLGSLLFSGRLRFVTSFILLLASFFLIYRFIDNVSIGEFDAFFISKQFLVFSILLGFGILLGWGLQRYASFSILVASLFFILAIYLLSKTGEFTMAKIIFILLPIIFYCIYLIFTTNELARFRETKQFNWPSLLRRLVLFIVFFAGIGSTVLYFMHAEIKETIEQYGGEMNDDNSVLKKNKDGTVQNQNNMSMANNHKRTNDLVFCAHINNFFEDSDMPNPLYLTSYYFTKFDTLTETFERDSLVPFNDEFAPDPSTIPLFSKETNTTLLDSALTTKLLKDVEIEVYKKKLAADAFVAPSTAYEVQPITVEKDFQKDYAYAYRAKSSVSALNSAYFIYNTDNPMIAGFQEERFNELRKAKNYENVDERFYKYYTHFPGSDKYQNFKRLADSLDQTAFTTIDKVLAIRSYFKQKNPLGEDVYAYSDNPGIPGLPGASKISTFMFETKKGWCTYYAGSTLLLLRAMNIPSRIAVGFMTVDRSDNNKGWYWFYQDQAHAWVQVYFPEYGWLDFDFTIGNSEAQQSPAPDQTPPMQPPKAVVVASGEIKMLDTIRNIVDLKVNHFIYNDKEYKNVNEAMRLNLDLAKIWKDSVLIGISELKAQDYVVGVSYNEAHKSKNGVLAKDVINQLPKPLPVDEIYFRTKKSSSGDESEIAQNEEPLASFFTKVLITIGFIVFFLLFFPTLLLWVYFFRFKTSKNTKQAAYRLFRYTGYYLNQLGYPQIKHHNITESKTLLEYATQDIEPFFNNQYSQFAKTYQRIKFSEKAASVEDISFLNTYFSTFTQNIKQKTKPAHRFKQFIKLNRAIQYLFSYQKN